MIKSLRLAWLKRILSENEGTWKNYLHLLVSLGGLFFFNCNVDIKDYTINSLFYSEILTWRSEFRENFASNKDWCNIIWNNKEICINNSPIFYKNFFDSGVVLMSDECVIRSWFFISKYFFHNCRNFTGIHASLPCSLGVNDLTVNAWYRACPAVR